MDPPSLLSFFLAISYFFFFPQISVSQEDISFRECAPLPFNCGNVVNVAYPFLAGNRSHICGYQNLTLACVNNSTEIEIQSQKYQIKRIDYPNRLLTVVPKDSVENDCPRPSRNTSFGNYLVEYTDKDEKLTLLYDCDPLLSSNSDFQEISCLKGVNSDVSSYFWIGSVVDLPSSPNNSTTNSTSWSNYCGSVVQVSLLGSSLDRLKLNASSYGKEMKEGFEMRWIMGAGWCTLCVESGGICGVNTTVSEESTCFCHDKPSFATCGAPPSGGKRSMGAGIVVAVVVGAILLLACFAICGKFLCCPTRRIWKTRTSMSRNVEDFLNNHGPLALKRYSYLDVKKMTNSFKCKIGEGAYGSVFKGKNADGRPVAVKLLIESKGNGEEFINEVSSIGRTYHVNIVTLLGFCSSGPKRALVYEFMPNGSLDKFIYAQEGGTPNHLGWEKLYQIALGIARGLEYLHRGCNTRILHFDIKPHNILLDQDFSPKIADFGLAKLCPTKDSIISMAGARGTVGYIAPEVFCRNIGGVSSKSDVYSYGMMVLEMVGGRKNLDAHVENVSEIYFPHYIYKCVDLKLDLGLHGIVREEDERNARKMIMVGLWCIQTDPTRRPSMSRVMEMLEGSLEGLEMPPKPYLSSPDRTTLQEGVTSYKQTSL